MNIFAIITIQDIKEITGKDTPVRNLAPLITGLDQATVVPDKSWVENQIQLQLTDLEYQNILKLFLARTNNGTATINMDTGNTMSNTTNPQYQMPPTQPTNSSSRRSYGQNENKPKRRRRQTDRSNVWRKSAGNDNAKTIQKIFEDRIIELNNDKTNLQKQIEDNKVSFQKQIDDLTIKNQKMEEKLTSNRKALYGKMATSTILAGKIHMIKAKLPLQMKLQLSTLLNTEVSNKDIQRTMRVMGLIKSDDIEEVELL